MKILLTEGENILQRDNVGDRISVNFLRKNETCILWCGKKMVTIFSELGNGFKFQYKLSNPAGKLFTDPYSNYAP